MIWGSSKPKAIVLGCTGLIGTELSAVLAQSAAYSEVLLAVRRAGSAPDLAGASELLVDYERPESFAEVRVRDVFCCLGTTIKKAGSQEAFRRVDYQYPFDAARVLRRTGTEQFLLVSALGADPTSSIFYNRVKGEVERAIGTLGFPGLFVFRPSLLLGDRAEVRPGEKVGEFVGRALGFAFLGPLRRFRPIEARSVALAMAKVAGSGRSGTIAFESEDIADLASGD